MSHGFSTTTLCQLELPDHVPKGMPYVIDDCSIAHALGFRNKSLWYFIIQNKEQYDVIRIPKRRSGVRTIHAPKPAMKLLLQRVNSTFLEPMHTRLGPHVTAYRTGLSVKDAALQHIPPCKICDTAPATPKKHLCPRKGLFLKMDLTDFFHTTTRAWIRRYFRSLGYSHYVSDILASLMTVRDVPSEYADEWHTRTPQGSPASGAICNLVADQRLDHHIIEYLKALDARYCLTGAWKWKYTRYSDDLSFTCGINPPQADRLNIFTDLQNIVSDAGYRVNARKTRVVHGYHPRHMLGMVINDKTNYMRKEYLRLRAIVHNCAKHGFASQLKKSKQTSVDALLVWLRGMINWINLINQDKGQKLLHEYQSAVTQHYDANTKKVD